MSTCEMLSVIHDARREQGDAVRDRHDLLVSDLRTLLALPPLGPPQPADTAQPLPSYCRWLESVQTLVLPKTAQAQVRAQRVPAQGVPAQGVPNHGVPAQGVPVPGSVPKLIPKKTFIPDNPARPVQAAPRPPAGAPRVQLSNWSQVATAIDRVDDADHRADRYEVEVHKKWAISLACISFVIMGIVMALRFPRGGIGLVIGGGLAVFSIYYVGLTAGESLSDRGFVAPWLSMWAPNIILTFFGVIGLIRVSRESGSTRGGDFQEVLDGLRHIVRRWRKAGA